MKRPIFYTLLAVLLVCFLSACVSDPPEPIPAPSTTAGDTGGSTDPSPDETTTDPADITSDDLMETEPQPIESSTTELLETTGELIICETELNISGAQFITYLNPLTMLDESFGNITDPVEVADTETPWYITEWETYAELEKPEVPEEKKNLAFRVPLVYEGICNEMRVKIEFFQEYYLIGEPIQVRITIENKTSSMLRYRSAHFQYPAIIEKNDGSVGKEPFGALHTGYFDLSPMVNGHIYWRGFYQYMTDDERSFVILPKGDHTEFVLGEIATFHDGVAVLEYTMTYDPESVTIEDTYTFQFAWYGGLLKTGREDVPTVQKIYQFSVPMDLVEVTLVPAE